MIDTPLIKINRDQETMGKFPFYITILSLLLFTEGCGLPSMSGIVDGLNRQTDLELVCDGAPSYLLMLDSMIASNPDDVSLLLNGTKAYSAYATVMPECGKPHRAAKLSEKARIYGIDLLAETTGVTPDLSIEELDRLLKTIDGGEVEYLFWGAYGWSTWIKYQQGASAAIIEVPSIVKIMERVIEIDETVYYGGAHIFLGVFHSIKPAAYGGKPELSRHHFEKALTITDHRFLPIQVAYAETYGKMLFDRELYEKLLREVLAFELSSAPDFTLANLVAKKQARRLLEGIDDYF